MTLVVGLLNDHSAVICGDGRIFTVPANGAGLAQVGSEVRNKTFSAMSGRVIGGCSGMMDFLSKGSEIHCREIIDSINPAPGNFSSLVQVLADRLADAISQIAAAIPHDLRAIEVLVIARDSISNGAIRAASIYIGGPQQTVSISLRTVPTGGHLYLPIGSSLPKTKAREYIAAALLNTNYQSPMLPLLEAAVDFGILHAATNPQRSAADCGGMKHHQILS